MSDVFDRARRRRALLAEEIERIDAFLAMYQTLERGDFDIEGAPGISRAVSAGEVVQDDSATQPARKRGPNGSNPGEIVEAAVKIVYDHNRPMTRFELIPLIEQQGLKIGGVDKPRNLGTILWRSKRFENTGDGYWPIELNTKPKSENLYGVIS